MAIIVSEHARERFAERVWPHIHPGTKISNPESIDKHVRSAYASGSSIAQPFPIELQPWTKWVKLGDGKYLRWDEDRRIGMVCRRDGSDIAIITCFSAVLPGMTAKETQEAMSKRAFLRTLMAVTEICPAMSEEQHVAIASKLADAVEELR